MENKLISIGKASKLLGVSISTLRRWDKSGVLKSTRAGTRGHRYYAQSDLDGFFVNEKSSAREWAASATPSDPEPDRHCRTRDVFQARLEVLQSQLIKTVSISTASLVTAVAGEIGNNSFDHNLGNWPDIPGIFFWYSIKDRTVMLADRGLGILATLNRVRPDLDSSEEALRVAFTEKLSGRFPESRGNGLKFVRSVIVEHPFTLDFQTGNAFLHLKKDDNKIEIKQVNDSIRGCFAIIGFESLI